MKTYNVVITKEEDMYVALNPDTGVVSQGESIEEASENIREALHLYLEESQEEDEQTSSEAFLTTVEV